MNKQLTCLLMSLIPMTMLAQEKGYTRGIGIYPGNEKENFSPSQVVDERYKNLALMRTAIHSSARDRNLTAQLITDGILHHGEPIFLDVNISGEEIGLRDKEKTLDGNIHSSNYVKGEKGYIEYAWHGMKVSFDKLTIHSEIAVHENLATQGYKISVLASHDGKHWNIIGEETGSGLPGVATNQKVSSDPNKKEAKETLPLRLVDISIPVKQGEYSYVRVQINMPGCAYWRIYENEFFDKGNLQKVLPSYQFSSAWCSDGGGEQWVYVDLGREAEFDKVNLMWLHKPLKGKVQVSNDLVNWQTVKNLPTGKRLKQEISCSGKARFVRILMEQADQAGYYALSEMEVWGKDGVAFAPHAEELVLANKRMGLNGGKWILKRKGDSQGIPATVPATVLGSYINVGAVPNPTFSDNLQYISESYFNSDFVYEREFSIPVSFRGKRVRLHFDGINWKASIMVNGNHVGQIDGAFIRGDFDVTDYLKPGSNTLTVTTLHNDNMGAVKIKNEESTDLNGGVLGADNPTFHASIGWDWITTVPGREVGIWNDVYLSADEGYTIKDPFVTTRLSGKENLATVTPSVSVFNDKDTEEEVNVKGWIGAITFGQTVVLSPHSQKLVTFEPEQYPQLKNQKLHLWWPNGYGEPYLYDAGFSIRNHLGISDSIHYRAGIREVSYRDIDTETKLYVNGKRITPLGGNWGFSEMNLNYRGREYDAAVRYHKEMNYNMIRNWVGQIGDEEFYQACDKYGILVWQDFWLANPWDGPDPYDEAMFMANVKDYIQRIRKHPSIAIYVGRNEGYPTASLNQGMREQVKALHPQLGYIPSSADDGVSGHGPYRALPVIDYFKNQSHKLHSERGMPNVPTFESLTRILPQEKLWPQNILWGKHDYTQEGAQGGSSFNALVEKHFGKAKSAKQFTQWAQWVNYDGYRAMYESAQQDRMGLLIWMSHACWPSMVWQTYDYYFEPTAAYFGVKKACEPLHIQYNPLKQKVQVVCLDTQKALSHLTATLQTINIKGEIVKEEHKMIDAVCDSTIDVMPVAMLPDAVTFIRLYLKQGEQVVSENFYVLGKEEDNLLALRSLPKAILSKETQVIDDGNDNRLVVTVRNESSHPALMVRLNLKGEDGEQILPAIYDDNYFALMPKESKTIHILYHKEDGRGLKPNVDVEDFASSCQE